MRVCLMPLLFAMAMVPTFSQAEFGLKNFKTVMSGILYRGGGNGSRVPMSDSSLRQLCEAGFSKAFYLYGKGSGKTLNCGSNTIQYKNVRYSNPKPILEAVYQSIQNNSGPIYEHCWYGVHASGFIAAVALRQFCGYSAEQAVSYWNDHVPRSIRYAKIQKMIRDFKPSQSLQLSSSQASRYCP